MNRYLSWDVGITNLAYCLIEKNDTNFKIIKWGIISLRDQNENNNVCGTCKKNASLYVQIDGTKQYYCKIHARKYVPESVEGTLCSKDSKCEHVIASKDSPHSCDKKCYMSLDGKNYCKNHFNIHFKQIKNEKSLKKIIKINSNKIQIQQLAIRLFNELEKYPEFLNVNEVLIENQPSLTNPTMKTIAATLLSYFTLRGIIDKKTIQNIKFICPSNKLKISDNAGIKLNKIKEKESIKAPETEAPEATETTEVKKNNRKVYNETKKLGIIFCKKLIEGDEINSKFMESQKKKDDLCDCFLQAYYYLFCTNGVPQSIQKTMNEILEKGNDASINNL